MGLVNAAERPLIGGINFHNMKFVRDFRWENHTVCAMLLGKKRIAVGMSGGVDSAMTVCILQNQGWHVAGVTMKIWDQSIPIPDEGRGGCLGPHVEQNLAETIELARLLGVEHHVIPLVQEYKQCVLDYFCNAYLSGKTPNPCVRCNRYIKLGAMIQRARECGVAFEKFATGHYARIRWNAQTGRWNLLRGQDITKDQSYFLAYLTQEQLAGLLFPLGELNKQEVKEIARQLGFPELADKDESQDFLACSDYSILFAPDSFKPGKFVNKNGKTLGEHRGIIHYTIGQRKGLGLGGGGTPFFVLALDARQNRIIVGHQEDLWQSEFQVENTNWISLPKAPSSPVRCLVQIRQRHRAAAAEMVGHESGRVSIRFDEPQLSITPGQVAVFYDGDTILGAGEIMLPQD